MDLDVSAVCFGRDRTLQEETPRPYAPRQRDAGAEDDNERVGPGRRGEAGDRIPGMLRGVTTHRGTGRVT
jgi:hypothetical protein